MKWECRVSDKLMCYTKKSHDCFFISLLLSLSLISTQKTKHNWHLLLQSADFFLRFIRTIWISLKRGIGPVRGWLCQRLVIDPRCIPVAVRGCVASQQTQGLVAMAIMWSGTDPEWQRSIDSISVALSLDLPNVFLKLKLSKAFSIVSKHHWCLEALV